MAALTRVRLQCRRYRLEQMPYMEFYQGLRERNWTSQWYRDDAPPWRVQFFQDSGRFMAPAFPGYRCVGVAGLLYDSSKAAARELPATWCLSFAVISSQHHARTDGFMAYAGSKCWLIYLPCRYLEVEGSKQGAASCQSLDHCTLSANGA